MKRLCIGLTILALVLGLAGASLAGGPPNVVGTWSGSINFAIWDQTGGFANDHYWFSFEIQNQDPISGNFHGLQNTRPFTGNVSKNKVVTLIQRSNSGDDFAILTGKLSGKTITGTMQHWTPTHIDTGTFTLTKE
jgi:hypothetical protein